MMTDVNEAVKFNNFHILKRPNFPMNHLQLIKQMIKYLGLFFLGKTWKTQIFNKLYALEN